MKIPHESSKTSRKNIALKIEDTENTTDCVVCTLLNESRMQMTLQKPRMKTGSCVPTRKITINFCISIGNEYHLHWQSFSLNLANSLVTAVPNSQYRKIVANGQNANINGEISSVKFESSCDFTIEINWKWIGQKSLNCLQWFWKNALILVQQILN